MSATSVLKLLRGTDGVALAGFSLLSLVAVSALGGEKKRGKAKPEPPPPPLIEASGTILGVGIGTSMEQAHEKLDPLRIETSGPRESAREKGDREEGDREVWRLKETEYQWIVVWAKEEKILQLSASLRPDQFKPFDQIGDLKRAATNTESIAMWNVMRPIGGNFRLVAKGPARRASTIYMLSLDRAAE
jgi:hypothetical protein